MLYHICSYSDHGAVILFIPDLSVLIRMGHNRLKDNKKKQQLHCNARCKTHLLQVCPCFDLYRVHEKFIETESLMFKF